MLRSILVAGLILGGSSQIETDTYCPGAGIAPCAVIRTDASPARDGLENEVARIAARSAMPAADTAPLTQTELVSLYLLLSLQHNAKDTAS